MGIVHIIAPLRAPKELFDAPLTPPAVGDAPAPQLSTLAAFDAADGAVSTGTWEATPGVFSRAVMDAEFSHFVAGHATFVTADGQRFEFRAGDAAYFPPRTQGVWTIHQMLRKTYCIWR